MNEKVCEWYRDDCDDVWQMCGNNEFHLDNEDPDDAGMKYCCYCGGKLVWTVRTEEPK